MLFSSKMAPGIFNFSIVLSAEYLSYVKSIATYALTFFGYIISVLGSVISPLEFQITTGPLERGLLVCSVAACGCRGSRQTSLGFR